MATPIIPFKNLNLRFDVEKIESFDVPITVEKSFDDNEETPYPFTLEIEDSSYFYTNESDRDFDFDLLKESMPPLSFVHI